LTIRIALASVALAATTVAAQGSHPADTVGDPTHRAILTAVGRLDLSPATALRTDSLAAVVRFDIAPPPERDEAMPDRIRLMNRRAPADPALQALLTGGRSDFPFVDLTYRIPTPPTLARRALYLASAAGVTPLRLDSVIASVTFGHANPDDSALTQEPGPVFVLASLATATTAPPGGLVIAADHPLTIHVSPVALPPSILMRSLWTATRALHPATDSVQLGRLVRDSVEAQYALSIAGTAERWIFVQLADAQYDESCGVERFWLLAGTPPFRVLARSESACDL
jgi:hypothetical protein